MLVATKLFHGLFRFLPNLGPALIGGRNSSSEIELTGYFVFTFNKDFSLIPASASIVKSFEDNNDGKLSPKVEPKDGSVVGTFSIH